MTLPAHAHLAALPSTPPARLPACLASWLQYVLIGYVGDVFLSNGDHIFRPAAWLAFTFIMSITVGRWAGSLLVPHTLPTAWSGWGVV